MTVSISRWSGLLVAIVFAIAGGCSREQAMLDGAWAMEVTVPAGQPSPGRYRGTLVLSQQGTSLTGSVDDWSNGARSTFTGSIGDGRVRLNRLDREPSAGFRTTFEGEVAPDGTMRGTFQNDANAPHGNSATGTWRAARK